MKFILLATLETSDADTGAVGKNGILLAAASAAVTPVILGISARTLERFAGAEAHAFDSLMAFLFFIFQKDICVFWQNY